MKPATICETAVAMLPIAVLGRGWVEVWRAGETSGEANTVVFLFVELCQGSKVCLGACSGLRRELFPGSLGNKYNKGFIQERNTCSYNTIEGKAA